VETRELCELYLRGLLSDTARKNVEAMALELRGPEAVRSLQRFVSEYQCDEDTLRRAHWKEVAASLADPQGVWSVDASEFPKKGEESVGVAPQYCGALVTHWWKAGSTCRSVGSERTTRNGVANAKSRRR
jgi:SRSO17 transposase